MKTRYKIWVLISIVAIVVILFVTVLANTVIIDSYKSLENKKLNENIDRFHATLQNEINQLYASTFDWSYWDDTYMFVAGEMDEFVEININNESMANLRTDVMIYTNTSGNIIYERGFDYSEWNVLNVSPILKSYIYKDSFLVNFADINSSVSGIVTLPEGPMFIASLPVLDSARNGPINGAIIWGRYLDDSELNLISTITNLSISFESLYDESFAPDFQEAYASLSENDERFIKPINSEYIAGYSKVNDIFNQPSFLIKITRERDIYNQGLITITYFEILIIVSGVLIGSFFIAYLDITFLSRLHNLSKQVANLSKRNDSFTPVQIPGRDELNDLANLINHTIRINSEVNVKLESLIKQKNDFINQLGHDIKNPLTPLNTLLPILQINETDQKKKEIIDVCIKNVNYMKNLVIKTIELGKLNSSKQFFTFQDINLLAEIQHIIDCNKPLFDENHIQIKNNLTSEIIVNVDKLYFQELINNLLTNAIKYSNMPGIISIDVKEDTSNVTVSIKDSGIGMNNQQLNQLFTEFYKADSSRHDFNSSGLGLSICKRIVERHNGKIWAESEGIGKGSTFYFTIPRNSLKNKDRSIENIHNEIDKIEVNGKKNLK